METYTLLQTAMDTIDIVCEKLLQHKEYNKELQECIEAINYVCPLLLQVNALSPNTLQILKDMMYGMTQQDTVFLLDVLRFGLKAHLETVYQIFQQDHTEVLYE